jgi:phosphatidylglycerophosphatase C
MTDSTQQAGQPDGKPPAQRPAVAAFDFDGTLSRRDTMVPFLVKAHGWPRVLAATATCALRTQKRDALKVATVGHLFKGMPATELDKLGRTYAEALPALLRPEMVERVQWHKDEGHSIVVVSAGLTAYLRPLAEHLGLDHVMGVDLEADEAGILTGGITGGINNRGPAKVARLEAWLTSQYGPQPEIELWAYGDSSGDEELLARSDHPTWVGRRAERRKVGHG